MSKRPILISFLLVIATFLPMTAVAQTSSTFGIKAGVTAATLHPDRSTALDLSTIWGAAAGVFLGQNISDNLGLQVEVLASQRGAKITSTGVTTTNVRLTYVDLPVTVRLGNTRTDGPHFHVFTGPQVSFKVKARGTDEVFGATDLDDEVESRDFGWTLGVGLEQGAWLFDARYTHGFRNINSSPADVPVKNRTFTAMVGYRMK